MLNTLKRQHKINKKDRQIKMLVDAYASPWTKKRGTFRDHELTQAQRDGLNVKKRFENDVAVLSQVVLTHFSAEYFLDKLKSLRENNEVVIHAFQLILTGDALASQTDVLTALEGLNLAEEIEEDTQEENTSLTPIRFIHAMLKQLLDPKLIVFQYDYDFIDDIVPIIESRFIGENGLTNPKQSQRFLKALWILCGRSLETYEQKQLPQQLKELLGSEHPYKPARFEMRQELEKYLPSNVVDEFVSLRCADNPQRYVDISTALFRSVNEQATDKYEERDISLIYGYENNFHLTLRTLVRLIQEKRITAEDEVLILGPRYVDEVLFFRNILGLPKTIGLDLRDEEGLLLKGDMHHMPFENNRFKLVYGASVIEYAYNIRQVVDEIARVLKRPGYVANICRSNRSCSPSPTGRTDVGTSEAVTNLYYRYPHQILAKDPGLTSKPDEIGNFPSYVLQLTE